MNSLIIFTINREIIFFGESSEIKTKQKKREIGVELFQMCLLLTYKSFDISFKSFFGNQLLYKEINETNANNHLT